jgi:hypothetical protein
MSPVTVEGIYENGKVTLLETPTGVEKARVKVTFLPGSETAGESTAEQRSATLQRLMDFMHRGIDFGEGKFNREELYAERLEEMEKRRG